MKQLFNGALVAAACLCGVVQAMELKQDAYVGYVIAPHHALTNPAPVAKKDKIKEQGKPDEPDFKLYVQACLSQGSKGSPSRLEVAYDTWSKFLELSGKGGKKVVAFPKGSVGLPISALCLSLHDKYAVVLLGSYPFIWDIKGEKSVYCNTLLPPCSNCWITGNEKYFLVTEDGDGKVTLWRIEDLLKKKPEPLFVGKKSDLGL